MHITQGRSCLIVALYLLLSGCIWEGEDSGKQTNNESENPLPAEPETPTPTDPTSNAPPILESSGIVWPLWENGLVASFRDSHGATGRISGTVWVRPAIDEQFITDYRVIWYDKTLEQKIGKPLSQVSLESDVAEFGIAIAESIEIPDMGNALKVEAINAAGEVVGSAVAPFRDFRGDTEVEGKGGNAVHSWYYGNDRAFLNTHKATFGAVDYCQFDNGLVQVIDMKNQVDERENISADESLYPPYEFDCTDSLVNTGKIVWEYEEYDEVSTWSAINDAFFYGGIVQDVFYKYLGKPVFDDKVRLRVHYNSLVLASGNANWDGVYANFMDARFSMYGTTGLDIIAHEIAHGFLHHNTLLDIHSENYTLASRTVHEAFSDIVAIVAKHQLHGDLQWINGEEVMSPSKRDLSTIKIQSQGFASYLDRIENEEDFYLSMGLLTYPFYQLTEKWGIESAFQLFVHSALYCWKPEQTLIEAAECLSQSASAIHKSEDDVINAFKTVKIKLFDDGTLAHFRWNAKKREISFLDSSVSTNQVIEWHWDFGDGHTSNQQNPIHTYQEGGDYQVTVTTKDGLGEQDSFTNDIYVFEEYCKVTRYSGELDRILTRIEINGQILDLDEDGERYDYTNAALSFNPDEPLNIKVQGRKTDTKFSTSWYIWVDLDDDGIFEEGESFKNALKDYQHIPPEDPYEVSAALDFSNKTLAEGPLRMRISGDYAVSNPCRTSMGATIDIVIQPE